MEKQFTIRFKSGDGRRSGLRLTMKGRRLELYAEVEGSNKLKKIGESAQVGITMAKGVDITSLESLFQVLSL